VSLQVRNKVTLNKTGHQILYSKDQTLDDCHNPCLLPEKDYINYARRP